MCLSENFEKKNLKSIFLAWAFQIKCNANTLALRLRKGFHVLFYEKKFFIFIHSLHALPLYIVYSLPLDYILKLILNFRKLLVY